MNGRCRGPAEIALVALAFATGCTGDGTIDLLPEGPLPLLSAHAAMPCAPPMAPHPPVPAPLMMSAQPMMPPAHGLTCDSGPCPPMMPPCAADADANLADAEGVAR